MEASRNAPSSYLFDKRQQRRLSEHAPHRLSMIVKRDAPLFKAHDRYLTSDHRIDLLLNAEGLAKTSRLSESLAENVRRLGTRNNTNSYGKLPPTLSVNTPRGVLLAVLGFTLSSQVLNASSAYVRWSPWWPAMNQYICLQHLSSHLLIKIYFESLSVAFLPIFSHQRNLLPSEN